MLSAEDNEILTRTDAGTPMGELMRRYWQPVCALDELIKSPFRTKEVRIMGEELVVYRDRSGKLGIVDKYCAHRRASLAYGVVEEHGIRCQYHGWKYDETGACIEQPFEDTTHPEDNFRSKCTLRAYKAEELGGLVFAYMGPEPAPLLPRWGPLAWENAVREIAVVELPCNWLQCQENSLDPVHTEWLHGYAGNYFREILDGREPTWLHRQRHEDIAFTPFKYGIIKHRATSESERDLTDGHPILFPNILLVGNPLAATMEFRVPMDDTHCLHFSHHTFRPAPGTQAPKQEVVPSRLVPLYDNRGFLISDIQRNQDFMCWVTQGDIAKRDHEKLGESDRGIILFRKQLMQQVEILRDGGEPNINILRDPAMNDCIELPIEVGQFSAEGRRGNRRETDREEERPYIPQEAGAREFADNYANPLSVMDPQAAADFESVMRTWKGLSREKVRELITAVID